MDARIHTIVRRLADGQEITRDEQRILAAWSLKILVDAVCNYETTARLNGERMTGIEGRLDRLEEKAPAESDRKRMERLARDLNGLAKQQNREHDAVRDLRAQVTAVQDKIFEISTQLGQLRP